MEPQASTSPRTKLLTYPVPPRASEHSGSTEVARNLMVLRATPGLPKRKNASLDSGEIVLTREKHKVVQNLFVSSPWTELSALRAISSGAWFDGTQDFASREARAFALAAQSVQQEFSEGAC